jgi:hypothetical protein
MLFIYKTSFLQVEVGSWKRDFQEGKKWQNACYLYFNTAANKIKRFSAFCAVFSPETQTGNAKMRLDRRKSAGRCRPFAAFAVFSKNAADHSEIVRPRG